MWLLLDLESEPASAGCCSVHCRRCHSKVRLYAVALFRVSQISGIGMEKFILGSLSISVISKRNMKA
jgi:hypothetical protein